MSDEDLDRLVSDANKAQYAMWEYANRRIKELEAHHDACCSCDKTAAALREGQDVLDAVGDLDGQGSD